LLLILPIKPTIHDNTELPITYNLIFIVVNMSSSCHCIVWSFELRQLTTSLVSSIFSYIYYASFIKQSQM